MSDMILAGIPGYDSQSLMLYVWFQWSINVAGITEVPPVALMPNFLVQRKVLRPFRYQTGGTILVSAMIPVYQDHEDHPRDHVNVMHRLSICTGPLTQNIVVYP